MQHHIESSCGGNGRGGRRAQGCASVTAPHDIASPLSPAARSAVIEALEDEYHARAFYRAILERFPGAKPFSHIVEAESRHAAALERVLAAYAVPVPSDRHAGSEEIRRSVPAALACACEIAAQAEIENVSLYEDKLLPRVAGYQAIESVFNRLMQASRDRHLPAFQRCAARG
ncbi:ferritin-like domain-containing protein [Methylocella tundrae]|uniref:Uncharacterized protein n=1 Tax=Methylocella tundrae TaxID=227605 RepID=A0A4U8Z7E4_METTU|nr:DUF2202 domain-containing protein [Methylocella tundrae]WPP03020.1 DUF2202 domain-containing protein [Methylocella tundrae]VFU16779.1 conserved protein of unknown function [Methylocella tundrae]